MASAGRVLFPVLLALLAAGCLAPVGAPVERTAVHEPDEGATLPPADEPGPIHDGRPVQLPSEDDCGEMALEAEPRVVRPGEEVRFRATFRNCGTEPLERTTPCVGPIWEPRTLHEGVTYYVGEAAAHEGRICLTAIGHWRLAPGEAMEGEWRWNGTFVACGTACLTFDAPPGVHEFTAVMARKDAMTQAGEDAWAASVVVEVLPRA